MESLHYLRISFDMEELNIMLRAIPRLLSYHNVDSLMMPLIAEIAIIALL